MAFSNPFGGPASSPVQIDAGSITLTSSAATKYTYTVPTGYSGRLNINDCWARVTTQVAADSTAPTITIKKGTTLIGTITMADGTAANASVVATPASSYRSGVALAAGDTVVIAHTKAVDSSSAAGAATPYFNLTVKRS